MGLVNACATSVLMLIAVGAIVLIVLKLTGVIQ